MRHGSGENLASFPSKAPGLRPRAAGRRLCATFHSARGATAPERGPARPPFFRKQSNRSKARSPATGCGLRATGYGPQKYPNSRRAGGLHTERCPARPTTNPHRLQTGVAESDRRRPRMGGAGTPAPEGWPMESRRSESPRSKVKRRNVEGQVLTFRPYDLPTFRPLQTRSDR